MISGQFDDAVIKPLQAAGIISYTEPNRLVRASNLTMSTQNSPANWALERIDKRYLPLSNSFHYPPTAGKNVTVYILDTGVNTNHYDLGGRARFGVDFINNNQTKTDDHGHGTFVAGLIGGGKYGVAKSCSMVSVKVLDSNGVAPTNIIIRGIQYVISQHQKDPNNMSILNLSLDSPVSRTLNSAIIQATRANITVVVAAGNGDEQGNPQNACNYSPASASNNSAVITVGATDKSDNQASFSNYGPCVSLFAPGVNLVSISNKNPTGILTLSGTSFAAPLVSGFAALLMGDSDTPLLPADVKAQIINYTTPNIIRKLQANTPNSMLFGNLVAAKAGLDSSAASPSFLRQPLSATGALVIASFATLLLL
ncbi:peptidase S8/S53 domain-containing protein [Syncephalis fuscata]|nr:peptidase S8/S53 domain-containing protein [Syncephalis fuscata]